MPGPFPSHRSSLWFFACHESTWHSDVSADEKEFIRMTLGSQTNQMENWIAERQEQGFPIHHWYKNGTVAKPDTIIQVAAAFAIAAGNLSSLRCLAASGHLDLEREFPDHGRGFLHAAVEYAAGDIKPLIVRELLDLGANPERVDENGKSAADLADDMGHGLIGNRILDAAESRKKAREKAVKETHEQRLKRLDSLAKSRRPR